MPHRLHKISVFLGALLLLSAAGCEEAAKQIEGAAETISTPVKPLLAVATEMHVRLRLKNPLDEPWPAAPVTVPIGPQLGEALKGGASVLRIGLGRKIPFQLDDLDGDGRPDELFFLLDFKPGEERAARLELSPGTRPPTFDRKTYAMIGSVRGSTLMAWESELIGYYTYGPAIVDCFGKTKPILSGRHFFADAKRGPWTYSDEYGQDFMPVGRTLGVAGVFLSEHAYDRSRLCRPWPLKSNAPPGAVYPYGCARLDYKVLSDGPIRAVAETRIKDWRGNLGNYEATVRYFIYAGKRYCRMDIELAKVETKSDKLLLGVGLAKLTGEQLYRYSPSYALSVSENVFDPDSKQVVAKLIGLALIYPNADYDSAGETDQDGFNHLIIFDPAGKKKKTVYFCAAWDKDGGITSANAWTEYVHALKRRLTHSIQVKLTKP